MSVINKIFKFSYVKNGLLVFAIIIIFSLASMILWLSTLKIPHLDSFEERRVEQSTKIYARDGETLLFDVFEHARRTVISFSEMSDYIKHATLAIEDVGFYEHRGIKPKSIIRALLVNIKTGDFTQGGSTLTQQVVKNTVLTPEKAITRKLKEWIFSLRLEQVVDKNTIFELYLNETPYGGTIYGVEQASRSFFGKSAKDVTLAEAAYLAALPVAPTKLSPYGSNKDLLDRRKNLVLKEMYENNFINKEEYENALNEEVFFLNKEEEGIKAPHFVMYVQGKVEEKYGKEIWDKGGLRITTTLDYELQKKAERLALEHALQNEINFNAKNISMVVIDPKTGEILVMVGSRDYSDPDIDGNFNISTSYRQPGSAFKPFAYAQAFKLGYTPETVLFDLKTQFSTACEVYDLSHNHPCYSPQNYNGFFKGPVTMRESLAQSINVTAIKTLYLGGLKETAELAQSMGLENLTDIDRYGLTMVLGGGEVSLLDITGAYGVFANEGVRVYINSIIKIENIKGEIFEERKLIKERVLDKNTSLIISDILSDNNARAPMFGQNSLLHFPFHDVAIKTGTTNNYRDAWVIGYTPNIVIGAWAGNNDNTPMDRRVASLIITPFWRSFAEPLITQQSDIYSSPFPKPSRENVSGFKPVLRGVWQVGYFEYLSIPPKEGDAKEDFEENNDEIDKVFLSKVHSILHWVDKKNPRGPIPINPNIDPQYKYWEYPIRVWVEQQEI